MQPVWHADVSRALAAAIELPAPSVNRAVNVSGAETLTSEQLYARVAALIDRRPLRVPVPDFLAAHGARLAEALMIPAPFDASQLAAAMSSEGGVDATENALESLFGVTPMLLDLGVRTLIRELDELTPARGVGRVEVKRFHAKISGSPFSAGELLDLFRARFAQVMPIDVGVEPAAPHAALTLGEVVTMALPGRGHVQVRVEEVAERHVVVGTLRGHALAGIVRFSVSPEESGLRFEVMTCDAAANALDWIGLTLGGARMQDANWAAAVQNVVDLSGGRSDGVQFEFRKLDAKEADAVEEWICRASWPGKKYLPP
jgi:hypothetical protein